MAMIPNKRSTMTLYSGALDIYSHRVRIVLAEKGVTYEVINVEGKQKPQELLELSPYGAVPTLVDRDLAIYDANIAMEYLDERFPHPPLMPVYPIARAKAKLVIYRIDREWGPLIRKLETGKASESRVAAKEFSSHLIELAPVFNAGPYFLGEDFTIVDCCILPILWRLSSWEIALPPAETKAINKYAKRLFQKDCFQASLTEAELELLKTADVD